jgi:hypothetical protein
MGKAGCACGALTGGVMALGIEYGRTSAGAATSGMFEAAKELHDRLTARFEFGSSEHNCGSVRFNCAYLDAGDRFFS